MAELGDGGGGWWWWWRLWGRDGGVASRAAAVFFRSAVRAVSRPSLGLRSDGQTRERETAGDRER